MLTGEQPEVNAEVARAAGRLRPRRLHLLRGLGLRARAGARACCRTPTSGVLRSDDLARLREVTASQGLMLESVNPDLVVHQGSPTKHPERRLETIRAAGELKIPFTSGILVGIGETPEQRVEALEALAAVHAEHGHLQEVILQNFVPHPRYYGAEPAQIADAAQRAQTDGRAPRRCRPGGSDVTLDEMRALVRASPELMPDVGVQIPPNLSDWWLPLVEEGATDLGGLSANGDHISPEHPFPSPHRMRKDAPAARLRAHRAPVRLPAVHGRRVARAGRARRDQDQVLELHPARAARGAATDRAIRSDLVPGAIERGRAGRARSEPEELTALFAETRPEAIEDMRQAADELRAELAGDTVTFVVNRNINVSNVCTVGCAFCGFGQGRRSPDAYEHDRDEFVARVDEAVAFGATEMCMQSGIHPDWGLEDYEGWLRLAKETAPQLHLHAYSAMEVDHMCDGLRPAAGRGVRPPARGRAGLDAGHRRRGARRRRAPADLAEQAAGGALGGDHRGQPRAPACAPP